METRNSTEQQQRKEQTVDETETDALSSPSIYEKNFDGHLPLHWLQPIEDSSGRHPTETTLPSFRDLRLKTHRTLYGTHNTTVVPPRDKSPKGSVDAPIRHLVDLINSHSRFCTLSSCSGRLSLFDPNGSSHCHSSGGTEPSNDESAPAAATVSQFTEASGKGRGSWVLVSHDRVHPEALVEVMIGNTSGLATPSHKSNKGEEDRNGQHGDVDEEGDLEEEEASKQLQPWTFRFEPMLLHIAAASLEDGRRLLTIALNLGFRESGLVVTDKRVTVAIRSHSLSTVTPLFPGTTETNNQEFPALSSLCVPPSYLRALVNDANQRLEANWKHLDRLYRSIESVLFRVRSSPPPLMIRQHPSSSIPSLNLWNAAAIGPLPQAAASKKPEVWVLGGYGCGPRACDEKHICAKRSSKLYRLEHEGGWKSIGPSSSGKEACAELDFLEVPNVQNESSCNSRLKVSWWKGKAFPDLQGMTSCRWRDSLVLFWGGRSSPSKPSNALYVLEGFGADCHQARIGVVEDVRGELPVGRWGHQLLTLSDGRAVLLGGCNTHDGAFDDVFVLHFCTQDVTEPNENQEDAVSLGYFYWERLSIRLPTPRYHFGAAVLNGDSILVVGGLESTKELLLPFEADTESESSSACAIWAFHVGNSRTKVKKNAAVLQTQARVLAVETPGNSPIGNFESFFAMACCTLFSKNLLLVTGGIQQNLNTKPSEPIQAFWLSNSNSSTLRIQRIGLGYESMMEQPDFDFGSLVHHCCVPLADNELLLVGGGVPSFAFGESYARSQHLVIDKDNSSRGPIADAGKNKNTKEDRSNTPSNNKDKLAPTDPTSSSNGGEAKEIANVIYVVPKHARQAKDSLQQKGWLEKRYRMIKVEHKTNDSAEESTKQMIALPISAPFSEVVTVFGEFILGHGEEQLPLSTSQYASKTKQKR